MKNIIYQYWKGDLKPGVKYSCKLMKEYAKRIGAEYRFDLNKTIAGHVVNVPIYYEPANPLVCDDFDEYDNVMLCDVDIFPTEGLSDNIFDLLDGEDAGICTEPKQPYFRTIYASGGITSDIDKRWVEVCKKHWGIEYSFDKLDRPEVFNTGVVVISKAGLKKMKTEWPTFQEYANQMRGFPNFYRYFQDYFSAFIHLPTFNFKRLPNEWNCYMHKVGSHPNARIGDNRPDCGGGGRGEGNAKLVHIMFRTADDWSTDVLWRITNKPIAEWNLHLHKEWPNDPPKNDNSLLGQLKDISNVNS